MLVSTYGSLIIDDFKNHCTLLALDICVTKELTHNYMYPVLSTYRTDI